jgi:PHP family Zn ribbon phosphoesterase
MKEYRADLHVHTVLSPCADLEMTPAKIIQKAKQANLGILGITDHNSTKNAILVKKLAAEEDIFVLTGVEVTTREEVHCLAFFERETELNVFQAFLEDNITRIPNPEGHFGYQPVLDENENIIELIDYYLAAALKINIHQVQKMVYELNGIFIPAHVNRAYNGIFAQLGFIPAGLQFDALGITKHLTENKARKQYALQNNISLIRNSDAHFLDQLGQTFTNFRVQKPSFNEVKKALNQVDKRLVKIDENDC